MKLLTLISAMLISFSSHAQYLSAFCKNTATGASISVISHEGQPELGTYSLNSTMAKNLYAQGVGFVADSIVGNVTMTDDQYSFTTKSPYTHELLSLETQAQGTLLTYIGKNEKIVSTFFFNPGECKFINVSVTEIRH